MEFPRARINDVKDNAPADTRATRYSIAIEIDGYQCDVVRLSAGALDLPSADWADFH
jgi:hypothetical protein